VLEGYTAVYIYVNQYKILEVPLKSLLEINFYAGMAPFTDGNDGGSTLSSSASSASGPIPSDTPSTLRQKSSLVPGRETSNSESDSMTVATRKTTERLDILYRATCQQFGHEEKIFYSDKPFMGLQWDNINQERLSIRDQGAISAIEIEIKLFGRDLSGKPGHTRDSFISKLYADIEFGKDFIPERLESPPVIHIHSYGLQQTLRNIVKYYPSQTMTGKTIIIHHPYQILMHNYHELQAFKDTCPNDKQKEQQVEKENKNLQAYAESKTCDQETAHDIGVLLKYLAPQYYQHIEPELRRHSQPYPVATFGMLWLLFKPGEDVYRKVNDKYTGHVVQSVSHEDKIPRGRPLSRERDRNNRWVITVWNLTYKGQNVFRERHKYSIPEFQGEREITSLNIFPSKFLDRFDDNKTRKILEARGQRYYELIKESPAHMSYTGTTERNSPLVTTIHYPTVHYTD
jgi:hypothetical protein